MSINKVEGRRLKVEGTKSLLPPSAFRLPPFRRGFTLIEVMVATAVLAFGSVLIYQSLFMVLNAYDSYARYVVVEPWMHEKIFEIQESIRRTGSPSTSGSGDITLRTQRFLWRASVEPAAGLDGLFRVDLEVSSTGRQRMTTFTRSAYALADKAG